MDLVEIGWDGMNWIGLGQNREKWRALLNAVVTVGFYKMLENYRVASQLMGSRVVLSSIELVHKCEEDSSLDDLAHFNPLSGRPFL
jgi:hypothetical protein